MNPVSFAEMGVRSGRRGLVFRVAFAGVRESYEWAGWMGDMCIIFLFVFEFKYPFLNCNLIFAHEPLSCNARQWDLVTPYVF